MRRYTDLRQGLFKQPNGLVRRAARRLRRQLGRVRRRLFYPELRSARAEHLPDPVAAVPFGYDLGGTMAPAGGIAVICHLFYHDLAAEMRGLIENIPFPADLFFSTDMQAKKEAIEAVFADWGGGTCEVRISPNRGRDIAPKLITFEDVYARYELVLCLHGKKTVTSTIGDDWRRTITDSLCGTPDVVRSIVDVFAGTPDVGMVMAQHFEPISEFVRWDGNFRDGRELARRMGIPLTLSQAYDYPSGSMFWARGAAIKPLLDLRLTFEDFPEEQGQMGLTIQHAIERLFLLAAERTGFRGVKVAAPARFRNTDKFQTISSRAQLASFLAQQPTHLLPAQSRPPARNLSNCRQFSLPS